MHESMQTKWAFYTRLLPYADALQTLRLHSVCWVWPTSRVIIFIYWRLMPVTISFFFLLSHYTHMFAGVNSSKLLLHEQIFVEFFFSECSAHILLTDFNFPANCPCLCSCSVFMWQPNKKLLNQRTWIWRILNKYWKPCALVHIQWWRVRMYFSSTNFA